MYKFSCNLKISESISDLYKFRSHFVKKTVTVKNNDRCSECGGPLRNAVARGMGGRGRRGRGGEGSPRECKLFV